MMQHRPTIKFKPTMSDPLAVPSYSTNGAVGADLRAAADVDLYPGKQATIQTGYNVEIEDGYELQVRSRSGLASVGVFVVNAPGTIDPDFRGSIGVMLFNSGDRPLFIKKGDRVAQLVVAPVVRGRFVVVEDELTGTDRGTGGFGSTGIT